MYGKVRKMKTVVHAFLRRGARRLRGGLAAGCLAAGASAALAAPANFCSANQVCYCYDDVFKPVIEAQVVKLRAIVADERAKGKAVGYISLPLTSAAGGVFGVNRDVGVRTRERIEARLGPAQVRMINPGAPESDLPNVGSQRAGGAEYMVMWTRFLEGENGLGEDFDFVYFVGPSDFAAFLGLTGQGDMERVNAYFDERIKTDAEMQRLVQQGRLTRQEFRNYYALRGSINVSLGAHDEWNIAGRINARRRGDARFGVQRQMPTYFDGRAVSSAESEQAVSTGYTGACKAP